MKTIIITALLAATARAAPNFKTTIMDAAAAVAPTLKLVPICKFDPVKGEYICPFVSKPLVAPEEMTAKREAEISDVTNTTALEDAAAKDIGKIEVKAEHSEDVKAVDCPKCQRDWEDCMKHWMCGIFYDCRAPCRCQVANNNPQCKACEAGQCHA